MNNISTERFNLSLIKESDISQIKNTSSINDEVLDLSDQSRIEEELTSQVGINTKDNSGIKAIKIGSNFYNIPKGDDLKIFIEQIKEFALNGNKLKDNFDIKSFDEITGIKLSSQDSYKTDFSLPESSKFILKGLNDKDYNNAFKSKISIFNKANQDILIKINEIDKAISNNTNPDSDNKLKYMRNLYVSLSKIYNNFSKDLNPSKIQINALQQEFKNINKILDQSEEIFSSDELNENAKDLKEIIETVDNLQNISNAFIKYGGKSESAANDLNKFSLQVFQRFADKNRNIEKLNGIRTITGAVKSFGYDISDMIIYKSKLDKLLSKIDKGGYSSRGSAANAAKKIAPLASNKFQKDLSNIGRSAQASEEAEQANLRASRNTQNANKNLDESDTNLLNAQKESDKTDKSIKSSNQKLSNKDVNNSKNDLADSLNSNNNAKNSVDSAKVNIDNAKSDLNNARKNSTMAKKDIKDSRSYISNLSYSKDLETVTNRIEQKNTTEEQKNRQIDSNIELTQKRANNNQLKADYLGGVINEQTKEIINTEGKIVKIEEQIRIEQDSKSVDVNILDSNSTISISKEIDILDKLTTGTKLNISLSTGIKAGLITEMAEASVGVGGNITIDLEKTFATKDTPQYQARITLSAEILAKLKAANIYESELKFLTGVQAGIGFKTSEEVKAFTQKLSNFVKTLATTDITSQEGRDKISNDLNSISSEVNSRTFTGTRNKLEKTFKLKVGTVDIAAKGEYDVMNQTHPDGTESKITKMKGEVKFNNWGIEYEGVEAESKNNTNTSKATKSQITLILPPQFSPSNTIPKEIISAVTNKMPGLSQKQAEGLIKRSLDKISFKNTTTNGVVISYEQQSTNGKSDNPKLIISVRSKTTFEGSRNIPVNYPPGTNLYVNGKIDYEKKVKISEEEKGVNK